MLRRLRKSLFHNLGIKAIALILALAVYVHVYSRQDQVFVMQIPLRVEGLPRDLTYRDPVPESVRVRFRARGREVLRLRTQPPGVVVRLNHAQVGLLQRPVTISDVELHPESDVLVEAIVDPVVLVLGIEPLATAKLPVAIAEEGVPHERMARFGKARVWPDSVVVLGPAGVIEELDSVRTRPVSVEGRTQTVGEVVELDLPDGVRTHVDRVTVRIPLVPVLRRLFNPLRVELPREYRSDWELEPDSVRVELSGPRNIVEVVQPAQLRLRVVPSYPPVEDEIVPVQLTLPGDIRTHLRVESIEPPDVRLRRRL